MVHCVEDFFVHHRYGKPAGSSEVSCLIDEAAERQCHTAYIGNHYHREILPEHALGYINYVYSVLRAHCTRLCDYTDAVLARYGNYCFHSYDHSFLYIRADLLKEDRHPKSENTSSAYSLFVFGLFDIAEIYILISLGTADFKLSRRLLHEIEKFSLKIADAENGYEFILDIRL